MYKSKALSLLLVLACILSIWMPATAASTDGGGEQTSMDGRISIKDGQLVVPGGAMVTYQTHQTFSGDYTIEMKAAVSNQAVGLLFGSGSPNPPLWILALVEPYGLWAHMPGDWSQVDKIPASSVQKDRQVTLRLEIEGRQVTSYLDGEQTAVHTLPAGSTDGPLGLRFHNGESGVIDYIRVTQDNQVIWEDPFDTLDSTKWNFPTVLENSMQPVWQGNIAYDETVWPIAQPDGTVADIDLLYTADEILAVQNNARTVTYTEGRDYTLSRGRLRILPGSTIPVMSYADYHPAAGGFPDDQGGSIYFPGEGMDILNRQIVVTYRHRDTWDAAQPADKSAQLPKTTARLQKGDSLNIVYYGDSITEGYNASGFFGGAPYQPKWTDLVTVALQKAYPRADIRATNTGLAGMTSGWGVENVQSRVNAYNPDLVVIAFGMNDAGGQNNAPQFQENTRKMMEAVRAHNPDCEFVLVSTTLPNPSAIGFAGCHETYAPALAALEGEGGVLADMTALHQYLLSRKSYADMTGNNVNHPNDYLSRVYAQLIVQTVTGGKTAAPVSYTDIPYVENSTLSAQTLDLQLPETGSGPYPVLVYIHGGAWVIGDKTSSENRGFLDAALAAGYAVASINYRLAQNAQWPAQIYDCKAAVRFLRANAKTYNLDPDRMVAVGASAGAHLAQFMGATNGSPGYEEVGMGNPDVSSDVQAVVSFYGISDLTTWKMEDWLSEITTTGKDPVTTLLGDGYTREEALDASPITHISAETPPMFIAHGLNDTTVNPDESTAFAPLLSRLIGEEQVDTYFPAQGQHADEAFWNQGEPVERALAFLQKQFAPGENLSTSENQRPAQWTVSLSGYKNAHMNLAYADASPAQKLHLILPEDTAGPAPLIIFVHGGSFSGGNSTGDAVLYTAAGALQAVERGYAVALVDYRCAPEAYFPEPIYDVKAAIRYLRAHARQYGLDPDRFALWGESAGGLLVDLAGLTGGNPDFEDLSMGNAQATSEVQAVVSWYAITDMTTPANAMYCPNWLGVDQSAAGDKAATASPITHVSADAPPFYLQHGLADNEVSYTDSQRLYTALQAAREDPNTRLELFPGITHAVGKFLTPQNADRIITWLDGVFDYDHDDRSVVERAAQAAQQAADTLVPVYGPGMAATDAQDLLAHLNGAVDLPSVDIAVDAFHILGEGTGSQPRLWALVTLEKGEYAAQIVVNRPYTEAPPPLPGDLDDDGEVTIADVMEACKVMARDSAGTDPTDEEIIRGDLDGDGEITIADVMEICKILARQS